MRSRSTFGFTVPAGLAAAAPAWMGKLGIRRGLVSTLLLWLMVAAPAPANAQLAPIGFDPIPIPRAADAFAGVYGAKVVDEVAAVLRESVDPACLRSSGRAPPNRAQTLALLVRFGQQSLDRFANAIDRPKAMAAFLAAEGSNAMAEAERLARDPKVRELLAMMEPLMLNAAVDFILEQMRNQASTGFARRIDIGSFPSDFAFVRERQMADADLGQRLQLRATRESPGFVRLRDLANSWTFVSMRHIDLSQATSRTMEGFVPELRAACIGRR